MLLEKLAAEENEKRLYAVMQMQQIMFAGDPYRINPKGTKETLLAATPESVTAAWHRMLRESKMLVTVVGSTDPEAACAALRRRLEGVERAYQPMPAPHFVARCGRAKKFVKVSWCWAFVWICARVIRWHRLCAAFAMCSAAARTLNSL